MFFHSVFSFLLSCAVFHCGCGCAFYLLHVFFGYPFLFGLVFSILFWILLEIGTVVMIFLFSERVDTKEYWILNDSYGISFLK